MGGKAEQGVALFGQGFLGKRRRVIGPIVRYEDRVAGTRLLVKRRQQYCNGFPTDPNRSPTESNVTIVGSVIE